MNMYKVVHTTNEQYKDMILPIADDLKIGDKTNVIGIDFTVSQAGDIMTLVNKDLVFVFQKVIPEKPKVFKITDPSDLRINKEIDIFFETKEIRLNVGVGNLNAEYGLTYDALFKFLMKEWRTISSVFPEHKSLPMENEFEDNYCLINGWNWFEDYNLILKDGCWSRKNEAGRHI